MIFRLPGGKELEATRGYVPDAFFEAARRATANDMVYRYEGGFVLSTEMHQRLDTPGSFASYAVVGMETQAGTETTPELVTAFLERLKASNHARPLESHYHYQVFFMEYIEEVPDDD